jgi:microcystin-dependent protein
MEADKPLTGATVQLQQYDPSTGLWNTVASTTTGGDGSFTFTLTLPDVEGTIKLRTYFPGSPEYREDASPSLSINIKRPKAARSMVSLQVIG